MTRLSKFQLEVLAELVETVIRYGLSAKVEGAITVNADLKWNIREKVDL